MLIFRNVTKTFTDTSYGVKDVTFEVEPGELVFITGNSGSGKTTLMRLLTKDYVPTEGDIHLEEMILSQVKSANIHELRRKVGVIFQDYKLLPELNVWENISLPLYIIGTPQQEVEQRVSDLLRLVGLADKAALFPSQLSGGEAQRVSIARALTTGPSVIFADEPTGNLDPETALAIASLLHKINTLGTTLLFATHNLDFIKKFKNSRHIHLEDGVVVLDTKASSKTTRKQTSEEKDEDEILKSLKKHTHTTEKETKKHDHTSESESESDSDSDTKTESKNDDLSEGEEIKTEMKKQEKKGFFSKLFGKKGTVATKLEDDEETENKD